MGPELAARSGGAAAGSADLRATEQATRSSSLSYRLHSLLFASGIASVAPCMSQAEYPAALRERRSAASAAASIEAPFHRKPAFGSTGPRHQGLAPCRPFVQKPLSVAAVARLPSPSSAPPCGCEQLADLVQAAAWASAAPSAVRALGGALVAACSAAQPLLAAMRALAVLLVVALAAPVALGELEQWWARATQRLAALRLA